MPSELVVLEQNVTHSLAILLHNRRDVLCEPALVDLREEVIRISEHLGGSVPMSKEKNPQYRRVRRLIRDGFTAVGAVDLGDTWYRLVHPDGREAVVDPKGRVFTYGDAAE